MSEVKSPSEKKRISLVKDRRNVYGECPASSRKNIKHGKQRGHMEVRRAAKEELRTLKGASLEADADVIESRAKDRILALARSSFKKVPDAPLGVVVARKMKRRAEHATGRKSRQLLISGPQARNPSSMTANAIFNQLPCFLNPSPLAS